MSEERVFKNYQEAQKYFDGISDRIKILKVHMGSVQEPEWINPIAFFKPNGFHDITSPALSWLY